jgi:serine/threonine protein kinase
LWFGSRRAEFVVDRMSPHEFEQLIVALDVWADGADRFPALLEARAGLPFSKSIGTVSGNSYTDMWEEELARRFGATNFIPLEPNHKMREGSLTVERQMAFGGASAIYLVRDGDANKFVLKEAVVPSDAQTDLRNKSIEMLRREAEHMSSMQHPGLARVLDYFVEEGRHYLVMEYLEGIDLRRLVREKGQRSVAEVIRYGEQIADIMRYLHARTPPLIHRDLTPDNIVLREDETIAVIDFGAANHFLGTATQTLIGKQAYMPAEQLRGKAEQRSDIYSLGATLYFLLTGKDPEPLSISRPKLDEPSVPTALDDLVAACTQLEPADRPPDMEVVLKRLLDLKAYVK